MAGVTASIGQAMLHPYAVRFVFSTYMTGDRIAGYPYRPNQAKQFRSMAHDDSVRRADNFPGRSTIIVSQSHAVTPVRMPTN